MKHAGTEELRELLKALAVTISIDLEDQLARIGERLAGLEELVRQRRTVIIRRAPRATVKKEPAS